MAVFVGLTVVVGVVFATATGAAAAAAASGTGCRRAGDYFLLLDRILLGRHWPLHVRRRRGRR